MKYRLIAATISLAVLQAVAQGGPGMMQGGGHGKMCHDKAAPSGCMMMSSDEMKAHHEKMRGMTDKKSCMAYMDEHHKMMQERATKAGETLPDKPSYEGCAKPNCCTKSN